jgi:hypothetical protein
VGGDSICQSTADSRTFGGTWKAWLSSAFDTPANRFAQSNVPYRLLDGTTIANNWTDLTNGSLLHAIDIDETSLQLMATVEVWTGTVRNGRAEGDHCNTWSSGLSTDQGAVGLSSSIDFRWTSAYVLTCDTPMLRLYCFEQ